MATAAPPRTTTPPCQAVRRPPRRLCEPRKVQRRGPPAASAVRWAEAQPAAGVPAVTVEDGPMVCQLCKLCRRLVNTARDKTIVALSGESEHVNDDVEQEDTCLGISNGNCGLRRTMLVPTAAVDAAVLLAAAGEDVALATCTQQI